MKYKVYVLSFLLIGFLSCKKETVNNKDLKIVEIAQKTSVKSYTYKELKPLLEKKDNKIYVVNFWATWCGPCVKELPYFEKINKEYADKNVEVLLVSLDFPKQMEKKLIPFIEKKNLEKINNMYSKESGLKLSEQQLKEEAAKMVRDVLPNYDLVPELLKELRSIFFV